MIDSIISIIASSRPRILPIEIICCILSLIDLARAILIAYDIISGRFSVILSSSDCSWVGSGVSRFLGLIVCVSQTGSAEAVGFPSTFLMTFAKGDVLSLMLFCDSRRR